MTFPSPPPLPIPTEPPLWAPYYGASIGTAFTRFWKKYATFSGRASRSEYWWWYLIYIIVALVFEIVFVATAGASVAASVAADPSGYTTPTFGAGYYVLLAIIWAIGLATFIPSLAIGWRRLHDTNRSGGFYFIAFIPLVGPIILIVFLASASDPAGARFDRPQF